MMKFNWGTGIALFLALFIVALISFVIFAWNQDVNLVHKDYYEKGVDYSARMDIESRSAPFEDKILITNLVDSVSIAFPKIVADRIDSGNVLFFRPSGHLLDTDFPMVFHDSLVFTDKTKLVSGRYIVKISWYSGGIPFEVDKTFIVQQ
jgi:hypothetical protein